ncbi:MAG: hypothetical protein P8Y67_13375, partial [Alphaproteobacteria bacterium]
GLGVVLRHASNFDRRVYQMAGHMGFDPYRIINSDIQNADLESASGLRRMSARKFQKLILRSGARWHFPAEHATAP